MVHLSNLKKSGIVPRVHGNGFLQLDLNEHDRLHIWGHRAIPRQRVLTPIHDHVFGFSSQLIVGRMINVIYDFVPREGQGGYFRVFEPELRDRDDTILVPTGETCDIRVHHTDILARGYNNFYTMYPGELHETFPAEPSATIITKTGPTMAQGADTKPRVLVPWDREPDNEFNRYSALDPHLAWDIVHDVLRNLCDL